MFFKKIRLLTALLALPFVVCAQINLSGVVRDAESKAFVAGAVVTLNDTATTYTDESGMFLFHHLPAGRYVVRVSLLGYRAITQDMMLKSSESLSLLISPSIIFSEEVIVSSTRAKGNSATTFSSLKKEDIKRENLGQDLPYVLNQVPSVVVSSDAGTGIGYTAIRIRGTDGGRTNLTINGIPVNDAESQGTFLVNIPDIASSVDNIQIQRGVGTSTNGAGAFGASINIQTDKISKEPFAEVSNSYGSFNSWKSTAKFNTGLINDHWNFEGRLSKITSDGYIDRATSDLKSFYTSGAYLGKKSIVKLNIFSGQERTYQAWNGVPESRLNGDTAGMKFYAASNYLSSADSANLFNSGNRTYNYYTYDNQTDNYQQDHYQLFYSQEWSNSVSTNIGFHYTRGRGYYEEYKSGESLSDYGLQNVYIGGDSVTSTDLIRRRWLDNDFYGTVYSLNYHPNARFDLTIGGAYNEYHGDHFGEIIWARFASNSEIRHKYYEGKGDKKDLSFYAKGSYKILNTTSVFADMQVRNVDYVISGIDNDLSDISQTDNLTFFNPKVGVSAQPNPRDLIYASVGVANKEPNRGDYINSKRLGIKPKPENLLDLEVGYRRKSRTYSFEGNVYYMSYKDQLVPTGELNDVGNSIRINIPESQRSGIEASLSWNISPKFNWSPNLALSMNKISDFQETVYGFDVDSMVVNTYSETDIAYSPNVVAGNIFRYSVLKGFDVSLISKYVGSQYLDNTSNKDRMIDAFFVNDLAFNYAFGWKSVKNINLIFRVNNILDEEYESNGYTYAGIVGNETHSFNFYYPQAGRNYVVGLNLTF